MKVKNIFSSELFEKQYERNDEPSLTIPDQTLSIKQILERYASGLTLEGKTPYYDESESEEYYPEPRYMDLAEREEYANQIKEELQTIKESSKRKQKSRENIPETTSDSE